MRTWRWSPGRLSMPGSGPTGAGAGICWLPGRCGGTAMVSPFSVNPEDGDHVRSICVSSPVLNCPARSGGGYGFADVLDPDGYVHRRAVASCAAALDQPQVVQIVVASDAEMVEVVPRVLLRDAAVFGRPLVVGGVLEVRRALERYGHAAGLGGGLGRHAEQRAVPFRLGRPAGGPLALWVAAPEGYGCRGACRPFPGAVRQGGPGQGYAGERGEALVGLVCVCDCPAVPRAVRRLGFRTAGSRRT